MKTIEERAIEYDAICRFCDNVFAFIAGAQSEHEELTRWNDPKEVLPDEGTEVLVKYDDMRVFMACYENSQFGWCCYEPRLAQWYSLESGVIAGWRNIY